MAHQIITCSYRIERYDNNPNIPQFHSCLFRVLFERLQSIAMKRISIKKKGISIDMFPYLTERFSSMNSSSGISAVYWQSLEVSSFSLSKSSASPSARNCVCHEWLPTLWRRVSNVREGNLSTYPKYTCFFFVSLSWYTKTRPITHNKSDTYIICCKPEDDLLSMSPVCVMYIVFSWESVRFWTASHDNRRFKLIISWKKSKDSTHFEVNSGLEISSKRVCAVYSWWWAFTHYRKIFARIPTDPVLLLKPSITQTNHYSHYNEDTTWVVNMLLETDTYFHIISTHTILCV